MLKGLRTMAESTAWRSEVQPVDLLSRVELETGTSDGHPRSTVERMKGEPRSLKEPAEAELTDLLVRLDRISGVPGEFRLDTSRYTEEMGLSRTSTFTRE